MRNIFSQKGPRPLVFYFTRYFLPRSCCFLGSDHITVAFQSGKIKFYARLGCICVCIYYFHVFTVIIYRVALLVTILSVDCQVIPTEIYYFNKLWWRCRELNPGVASISQVKLSHFHAVPLLTLLYLKNMLNVNLS